METPHSFIALLAEDENSEVPPCTRVTIEQGDQTFNTVVYPTQTIRHYPPNVTSPDGVAAGGHPPVVPIPRFTVPVPLPERGDQQTSPAQGACPQWPPWGPYGNQQGPLMYHPPGWNVPFPQTQPGARPAGTQQVTQPGTQPPQHAVPLYPPPATMFVRPCMMPFQQIPLPRQEHPHPSKPAADKPQDGKRLESDSSGTFVKSCSIASSPEVSIGSQQTEKTSTGSDPIVNKNLLIGDRQAVYTSCVTPPPDEIMNDLYTKLPPTSHPISPLVVNTPSTGRSVIARTALAKPLILDDKTKTITTKCTDNTASMYTCQVPRVSPTAGQTQPIWRQQQPQQQQQQQRPQHPPQQRQPQQTERQPQQQRVMQLQQPNPQQQMFFQPWQRQGPTGHPVNPIQFLPMPMQMMVPGPHQFGVPHPAHPPRAPKPKADPAPRKRPNIPYITIIAKAILSVPEEKMRLTDMYEYVLDNYPFYRTEEQKRWKNSLRHAVSAHPAFLREGGKETNRTKGSFWTIHPACLESFKQGKYDSNCAKALVAEYDRVIKDKQQPCNTKAEAPAPLERVKVEKVEALSPIQVALNEPEIKPEATKRKAAEMVQEDKMEMSAKALVKQQIELPEKRFCGIKVAETGADVVDRVASPIERGGPPSVSVSAPDSPN